MLKDKQKSSDQSGSAIAATTSTLKCVDLVLSLQPIIAPTTFECIIENDKFHMDHCNGHLLFTLLLRTFSVGTIAYDNIKLHN